MAVRVVQMLMMPAVIVSVRERVLLHRLRLVSLSLEPGRSVCKEVDVSRQPVGTAAAAGAGAV